MKRGIKIIRNTGIGIAVLYVVVCTLVYSFQELLIFHPHKLSQNHKYSFSWETEELSFEAEDGAVTNGLLCKVESSKGVVIFFHGNTGNIQVCAHAAKDFMDLGYDVLMYDYRSFGKSTGKLSEEALLQDAELVYATIKERYNEDRIIVYGQSIGTAIASSICINNNPSGLFLEAPYYSLEEMAGLHYPYLPASLLLTYQFRTHEFLKKVKVPVNIIHGSLDKVIPYTQAIRLREINDELITVSIIEGAGHNNLRSFEEYHKIIAEEL